MAELTTGDHAQSQAGKGQARRIELFEPAMCCETGVCGPSVDQQLIDVREDLRALERRGAQVNRHNLSSDPDAFVASPKVTGLIAAFGDRALPALLIDGEVAMYGRYPARDELGRLLDASNASDVPDASDASHVPDASNASDVPDASNASDVPDASNASDVPDASNAPDASNLRSDPAGSSRCGCGPGGC